MSMTVMNKDRTRKIRKNFNLNLYYVRILKISSPIPDNNVLLSPLPSIIKFLDDFYKKILLYLY